MTKIGILGGGQLGRMFIQNALNYPVNIHILDPDLECSCAEICSNFIHGSFNDYETVLKFGKEVDVIGIEIENVNTEALKELEKLGKKVIPLAKVIELFQDKGVQKSFYLDNNLATAPFYLIETKNDLNLEKINFPFVQKLRKGGYDGKGVQLIKSENDLNKIWNEPSVIEELAKIKKEISVIFVKNERNDLAIFPTVEMVFDDNLNLVDYIFSPAQIEEKIQQEIQNIILEFSAKINSSGIFAVELFLNQDDTIWINETAPRVHNSGHATIEGNLLSQYDLMLKSLLNLPFSSVENKSFSAMVNLIGEQGFEGEAKIENLEEITKINGAYLHWYGKKITKPGRKMGHITFIGDDLIQLKEKIQFIKETVKIKS